MGESGHESGHGGPVDVIEGLNREITRLRKIINHTEQTLAAALNFPKWGENPVGANPEERMVVMEDVTLLAEMAAEKIKELKEKQGSISYKETQG